MKSKMFYILKIKSALFFKEVYKKIKIGNFLLYADYNHKLDEYLNNFKYYSRNVPRIASYLNDYFDSYSILDIGANIGDTVALLRSYNINNKLYCIEGDSDYYNLLLKNTSSIDNVNCFNVYLDNVTSLKNISIDSKDGTAKLTKNENSTIKVYSLDDFDKSNNLTDVKFVKIDTDGFDLNIIEGSIGFIKKNLPILFFEYHAHLFLNNNKSAIDTLNLLQSIGYSKIIYYDNFGKLILSCSLTESALLKQLDNYIIRDNKPLEYYDVCVFHSSHFFYSSIIEKEVLFYQKESVNENTI